MRFGFAPALLTVILATMWPAYSLAAWQTVAAEPGKRLEFDPASIKKNDNGQVVVSGRIVLDKPVKDTKTGELYRIVEALNRFNCDARSYTTIRRKYFKDEDDLLREEIIRNTMDVPVRSGSLDDKLLREICRPESNTSAEPRPEPPLAPSPVITPETATNASKTVEKVNELTSDLRKANEILVQKAVRRVHASAPTANRSAPQTVRKIVQNAGPAANPTPVVSTSIHWSYEGEGSPANWGKLKADYALCANGKRQSPIDIRDGIRVDLEPIQFAYLPSQFRVIDNGHTLQVTVGGSSISLLGKTYQLVQFHFHHPAEERIDGTSFPMVVHLVHKSEDNKLAVVAIFLTPGEAHPLIQTLWNNIPLEKNEVVSPPTAVIDVVQLLPDDRSYYTYMGSLTTPPCTEDVLWLVLKTPLQISAEQLAIFERLYKNNARPLQPSFDRLIKASR